MAGFKKLLAGCYYGKQKGTALKDAPGELIHHPKDGPLEEETLPGYRRCEFFAVHIGQVLNGRYRVLGKLGHGASSAVWFCRDLDEERYVAVKVCTASPRLNDLDKRSKHRGMHHIQHLDDAFILDGAHDATHRCFVYRPACATLVELYDAEAKLTSKTGWIKEVLRSILHALDFLYTQARLVHADLKPDNIFFTCPDWTLGLFAQRLLEQAPVGTSRRDRIIYRSISFLDLLSEDELCIGRPLLGDFGAARLLPHGRLLKEDIVAVELFRAPETILSMPWNAGVDIWAFGVLMWLCLTREYPFCKEHANCADGEWPTAKSLAEMIGLLGPPSREYLRRSAKKWKWWELDGRWKASDGAAVEPKMWDEMCWARDDEQKALPIDLTEKVWRWEPEERASARELLRHPFLAP